jgi:hypothetical protein
VQWYRRTAALYSGNREADATLKARSRSPSSNPLARRNPRSFRNYVANSGRLRLSACDGDQTDGASSGIVINSLSVTDLIEAVASLQLCRFYRASNAI